MKYIKDYKDGDRFFDIYLCKFKQSAVTKNGKPYDNVILQDKTGTIDGKIWDLGSPGIGEFGAMDYIFIDADVTMFQGAFQLNIRRVRVADEGEYYPGDYLPMTTKDINAMHRELGQYITTIRNEHLRKLAASYFINDQKFMKAFCSHSAAKSVHHGFVGGLLEHTLSVVKMGMDKAEVDMIRVAGMFHDIGKVKELSSFPENDYTDEGQLIGHIIIGAQMVQEGAAKIPGFPKKLENELVHCVLAHHGELEYGSPKKPALIEAMALNLADNADAKLETMTEILRGAGDNSGWLGYNRFMESNIRKTSEF